MPLLWLKKPHLAGNLVFIFFSWEYEVGKSSEKRMRQCRQHNFCVLALLITQPLRFGPVLLTHRALLLYYYLSTSSSLHFRADIISSLLEKENCIQYILYLPSTMTWIKYISFVTTEIIFYWMTPQKKCANNILFLIKFKSWIWHKNFHYTKDP